MTSLTKNPKTKNYFSLQTRRSAESFEGLNSSLAQSTGELWSCKVAQISAQCVISKYNILVPRTQTC